MFERFTERARQVVVLSQEEARNQEVNYIGTEHVLLGLLREEEGLASRTLTRLGVTAEGIRSRIIDRPMNKKIEAPSQIPFTPRAKKVLEQALREALTLGHNYIGTEHILLGLTREREGLANEILEDEFKLDTESIRNEVLHMLADPSKRKRPILEQRVRVPSDFSEVASQIVELRKSEELLELLDTAIALGRQYPDRSTSVIAKAAIELHGKA